MSNTGSHTKAAIPLQSVVRLALWAAAFGLAFGAYLTYTSLQTA